MKRLCTILTLSYALGCAAGELPGRVSEEIRLTDGSVFTGTITRIDMDSVTVMSPRGVKKHDWNELAEVTRKNLDQEHFTVVQEERRAQFGRDLAAAIPTGVPAASLAAAYTNNELKAVARFDGPILVSGEISEMAFTSDHFPALGLDGVVVCVFDADDVDELASLNINDDILIEGVCVGLSPTIFSKRRTQLAVVKCTSFRVTRTAQEKAVIARKKEVAAQWAAYAQRKADEAAQLDAERKAKWNADRQRYAKERLRDWQRHRIYMNMHPQE